MARIVRPGIVAIAIAVLISVGWLVTHANYIVASTAQIDQITSLLAQNGIDAAPVTPTELTAATGRPADPSSAVKAAVADFGVVDQPVVFQATVTVADMQPSVKDRPMYLVQLTGLSIAPRGGPPGPVSADAVHHEKIVFVDATTLAVVFAVTGR